MDRTAVGKHSFADPQNTSKIIPEIVRIARLAGDEILKFYRSGAWTVTAKGDDSPLTQADLAANEIILAGIKGISDLPIVSEESDPQMMTVGECFWAVDPLDGTRDFVARRETFVVSIALIEAGLPVLGVIHAPVFGQTWWASRGGGAYRDGEPIFNRSARTELIAAGSRSMSSERMKAFCELLGVGKIERFGSALKFCKLAEGEIDLYPRFGPINEWDTAAGQIIAEEAGCKVVEISSQKRLGYGKPGFEHRGGFVASRADLEIVGRLHEEHGAGLAGFLPSKH
jgi:3'(2'), 5'-bisphosphate nucleotidase